MSKMEASTQANKRVALDVPGWRQDRTAPTVGHLDVFLSQGTEEYV
jgi:hypothetical protein